MTGPAAGEPDPGWAAPPRPWSRDGAAAVLGLLAAGLAFRLIIAYLLPGSGFGVDVAAFQYWADNLASQGLFGFYDRPFFHDYTPGYLYVLWAVGKVGTAIGTIVGRPVLSPTGAELGVGDLIKVPPIFCDALLGLVVWSMARELGASKRSAWIGAFLVIVNPVSWFDSAIWAQVDSVGTLVLLLAVRELWRDRPERSAVLAMLAALIKPQLGIFIPILAVVVIRRAFWPDGAYGAEDPPPRWSATALERRVRGPIRILTTGLAGVVTALVVSAPFGLSLSGLIRQIFSTAGGYPYVSVNAWNPWALATLNGNGVAANHLWVCDTVVRPAGPLTIKIGDFVVVSAPASTLTCDPAFMIGIFPALVVGAALFLVALAIILGLVARRPDRPTILVGLAVLAIAFFVLPTRVHERYLYPLVGIGAILAAVSLRWRLAYVVSAAATIANMYAIITSFGYGTATIKDWLGISPTLLSFQGVATAAIAQVAVFIWAFLQLRDDRLDELAEEVESAPEAWRPAQPPLTRIRPEPRADAGTRSTGPVPAVSGAAPSVAAPRDLPAARPVPPAAGSPAPVALAAAAPAGVAAGAAAARLPVWDEQAGSSLGLWEWFREKFNARPIRADRSRDLDAEPGGRLDRLDLWLLVFLVIGLLTVRMWRLSEPYRFHFDEVYHPRTAMEFLQDWRYGLSHDIYEWTHPHLAKYAMAVGIETWGDDRTDATSELGVPVTDAAIEPRWDQRTDAYDVTGDRLWVTTGSEVRAYDLATRALVARVALPGASAVAIDGSGHRVFVGTQAGAVETIDTLPLDAARAAGTTATPEAFAYMTLDGPIDDLLATVQQQDLVAVIPGPNGSASVVVINRESASELHRTTFHDVAQIAESGGDIAVAEQGGLAFLDGETGVPGVTVHLDGPARGVSDTSDLSNDPTFVSVQSPTGPLIETITRKGDGKIPTQSNKSRLPGDTAGRVYYDKATQTVHVVGSVQGDPAKTPTVYVIEPHADSGGAAGAVYADAALPATPAAIVLDASDRYPEADREQLLSLSAEGQLASVEIGKHPFAWRLPGVLAGVAMGALIYLLARLLFRRRWIAVAGAFLTLTDGMLFAQSRIGMNDAYVGLGIMAAYTLFAALWLRPGDTRRHWIAFWIGMPIIGLALGLALASKWVAAYAIGGLGILVLTRSALGRLILIAGLIVMTTVLGYLAISVPEGEAGVGAIPNYLFLFIMIGLTLAAVVANVLHPIAWSWEEQALAISAPLAAAAAILAFGVWRGDPAANLAIGSLHASPLELAFLAAVGSGVVYVGFVVAGRLGFGPHAGPSPQAGAGELLEPPAPAPRGWLRLGSGFGLPALWTLVCLVGVPLVVYVISYLPWAMVEGHQIVPGWPAGHAGQTLVDLTAAMYRYHNTLSAAHPASSPWWAWPFDFKPVWFYEDSFAGGTSASIYDAGNLVLWWLGIPAMAFVAWQAFKRRSTALALVAIGFACQWIAWARIDRAAFQYHYYTSVPFIVLAVAYFLAELWNGASRRTWLLARVAGGVAVLAPFGLWLLHRPLCAFVRVTDVNPGSQACPTYIPDLTLTPRAIAIAAVVGIGVLLLVRVLLTFDEDEGNRGSLLERLRMAGLVAGGVTVAFVVATTLFRDNAVIQLARIPVEPIALVVTLALTPVAAIVATARDARRFALGALVTIGFWFVLWYPNIAALPLPATIHNAYQGFLPTYVYPFQFPVSTVDRNVAGPHLLDWRVAALMGALTLVSIVVAYSAWTWRIALAERRREDAAWEAGQAAPG